MRHKELYEIQGVIKSQASNGLSVFEKSSKSGVITGQFSGGKIGDMVVRDKINGVFMVIAKDEWNAMPKDEKAANELKSITTQDLAELQSQMATLLSENKELKAKISELEKSKEVTLDFNEKGADK